MNKIIFLKDFTKYPGGRFKTDGPYSGEHFKDYILTELKKYDTITINLDGVLGLPHSFIDGCFFDLIDYIDRIKVESIEFPEEAQMIKEDYNLTAYLGDYLND